MNAEAFFISTDRFSLSQFNSLRRFVTYHHFFQTLCHLDILEEKEWQMPAKWNVKCLWRALLVEERRPAHTGGVWLHLRSWEAPLAKNPQTETPRESQGRSSASSSSGPSGPTTLQPTWTSLDIPGHIGHIPTVGRDTRLLRGPSFFPGKRQHFCRFGQGHKLQMCLLLVLVAYFFSGVQGSALTVCRV